MIERARKKFKDYNLSAVADLGITRAREHFGSSHTVVTYFPLNTLGKISQEEILWGLSGRDPVNLYLHIPFCLAKCGYCGYVSETNASKERIENYLSALRQECLMYADLLKGRKISSVYMGGGTPTILSIPQLGREFDLIQRVFDVEKDAPIRAEANPATLRGKKGGEKLSFLVQECITELSIGVQSFNNRLLNDIGRGYISGEEIKAIIRNVKDTGIRILNIDMMQDLPGQTLNDVKEDLRVVEELKPDSVTWYTMRITPSCSLYKRLERISDEDSLIARIMITDGLKELGYSQTSGDRFCLEARSKDKFKEARSSVTENMLGLGVSSYSHMGHVRDPWPFIFRNKGDIEGYIKTVAEGKLPVSEGREFTIEEEAIAQFVLGLKEGLELDDLNKRLLIGSIWSNFTCLNGVGQTGKLFGFFQNYSGYRKKIPQLINAGLLEFEGNKLQFTEMGRLFENEVCRELYSPIIDAQTRGRGVRALLKEWLWKFGTTPVGFKASA